MMDATNQCKACRQKANEKAPSPVRAGIEGAMNFQSEAKEHSNAKIAPLRMNSKVTHFRIIEGSDSCLRQITLKGQTARTLRALIASGTNGVTALELSSWALRLSAYVHSLKRQHLLDIEMVREPHATGWHGRYFLNTAVVVLETENA
jgi:Winged helix domain